METNKNLPPELVEKMRNAFFGTFNEASQQCAQIAVDYADQQSFEVFELLNKDLKELKQQRDELLGALRNLVNKHGDNHLTTWITKEINEAKQLLKKHEDGKE